MLIASIQFYINNNKCECPIRIMDSLNFLKFQPLLNWLDYFVDRQKFYELLSNAQTNANTIAQLLDQFIEQALSCTKELHQLERKQMDEDDIMYMRHKMDELWLCALSCLAAIDWDLSLLMTNSTVIKVQALWNKICLMVFVDEKFSALNGVDEENFYLTICNLIEYSTLTTEQIFVLWMYSQWILLVDINARFPAPSAKPTVSNPLNQIDYNLVQADRINNVVQELRKCMTTAVKQLNHLMQCNTTSSIEIFGVNCFKVETEAISDPSLIPLKNKPTPNFRMETIAVNHLAFVIKIQHSLMVAHFAAKHFSTAKALLTRINESMNVNNWKLISTNQHKLVQIDETELKAYSMALNFSNEPPCKKITPPTARTISIEEMNAKMLINSALHRSNPNPKCVLEALMNGYCVSKRFLKLMSMESFCREFIDEVAKQFHTFTVASNLRENDNHKRIQVYSTLYFFCLLAPGFAEVLIAHPQLGSLSKWRKLATTIETPMAAAPTDTEIEALSRTGPPLWNVLTSFDLEVIRMGLAALGSSFKLPYRHKVSEVIGETLLNRSGRIYNQVVLYLWKLEQLVGLNNSNKWKKFINGFMTNVIKDLLDDELQKLLAFDLIRAEIDIWNCHFCRVENSAEFIARTNEHLNLTLKSIYFASTETTAFIKFALPLTNFLLNNLKWKPIIVNMENKCFKSPFTDLARVLATYFTQSYECCDPQKAAIASDTFWQVMWPTVELTKDLATGVNRRQGPILLTKQQFLDFIANLKEKHVLNFLLGYTIYLLNSYLAFENVEKTVQQQQQQSSGGVSSSSSSTVATTVASITTTLTTTTTTTVTTTTTTTPSSSSSLNGLSGVLSLQKWIFTAKECDIWRQCHCDPSILDMDYIKSVMEILCRNAMIVDPVNVHWSRVCGDFYFVTERYEQAIPYYLEVVVAMRRKFSNEFVDFDLDNIFGRIAIGCAALQMPTLAAIIGQLRVNPVPHYSQVDWMLQNTPNTVDAGPAYFPLIADILLMEHMAAAYNKYGMTIYSQQLMKVMPKKSINANNSLNVYQREMETRKKRFLDVLFNQFFKQNV